MSKVNSKKIMDAIKEQSKRSKPDPVSNLPNKQSTLNFGQKSAF